MVRYQITTLTVVVLNALAFRPLFAAGSVGQHVIQIVEPNSELPKAMISGGESTGLAVGDVLIAKRPLPLAESDVVPTGKLKVFAIFPDHALAVIASEGTDESRSAYPKFPNIMAGDMVAREKIELAQVPIVLPERTIKFQKLFVDPTATPVNFELSAEGKTKLEQVAEAFAHARIETLLVEAHTDDAGPADANQIESYQRALTIRQYLIAHFGFDEDRVIAIGQGENEPLDESFVPGHKEQARRVVFRVIP